MQRIIALPFLLLVACPWDVDPDDPPPPPSESRVDLRARQTPIKNQGGRSTCITFAALAGLEAAAKRTNGVNEDLSEEFLNHVGKMTWLHPNWSSASLPEPRLGTKTAAFRENQVGAFGGGGGPGYIRSLTTNLRVIDEALLPYRPSGPSTTTFPELTHEWFEPFWDVQLNANDYNLHPTALPDTAILAPRSFAVAHYTDISPNDSSAIEAALRAGKEVVWDVLVEGTESPIWRTCRERGTTDCAPLGGHSMLIVGYDKTATDPRDHYFIVKNSWGRTDIAGADGFTYVSYDYLKNGYDALVIDSLRPVEPWIEARFVGRWQPTWSGPAGVIDLYHPPGSAQRVLDVYGTGIADKRFGGLYTNDGRTFRVNGSVSGAQATLFFDPTTPNLRWDALSGDRLELTLSADGQTMTGTYFPRGVTTGSSVSLRRLRDPGEFRAATASMARALPPSRDERTPLFPFTLP